MIAVEFRLKVSSMYSIRVPYSYQCARTYPLPAPSTIKGLCANALWRKEGGDPVVLMKAINEASLGATSRAEQPIAVSSCTVRVVPMNALLRQFAFTPYIDCMIAFKDGSEEFGSKIAEALKVSPVYLGDSESLVSVIPETVRHISDIEEIGEGKEITVNSLLKFDFIKDKRVDNNGVVLYMQNDPCADDAVLERYIAPMTQEGDTYIPLESFTFISARSGFLVRGNLLQVVFSEEKKQKPVAQKPKRGRGKKEL